MRVFDCFLFFNELELLEIRLTELDPLVDMFVLLESPQTFQGRPKPLFFGENRSRFAKWLPKIRQVVVEDNPVTDNPWVREEHQRECLRRGYSDAQANDFVIISDVDEIPSRKGLGRAMQARTDGLRFLETRLFYIALNLTTETGRTWSASFMGPRTALDEVPDFTELRRARTSGGTPGDVVVPDAGWHFSSVGGVAAVQTKLSSFSETAPEVLAMNDEAYLTRHEQERTLFFTGERLINVSPLHDFPRAVMADPERYKRAGLLTSDYADGRRWKEIDSPGRSEGTAAE